MWLFPNLANKQLQYLYCPVSHKVKAIIMKFGQVI